jgi:hypothetical protein
MPVSLDPDELRACGDAYTRNSEALLGHARAVQDLAALRAAFAGAGAPVWPAIEARLTELAGRLGQAHQQAARSGTVLAEAASGMTEIDASTATAIDAQDRRLM